MDIEVCTASIGGCQADWMAGMGHALSGGWRDVDSAKLPDLQIVFCTRRDVESARQASQDGAAQMVRMYRGWRLTNPPLTIVNRRRDVTSSGLKRLMSSSRCSITTSRKIRLRMVKERVVCFM